MPSKKTGKNVKGATPQQIAKQAKKTFGTVSKVAKKINQTAADKITVPLARKLVNQTRGAISDLEAQLYKGATPATKGVSPKSLPEPREFSPQAMQTGGSAMKKKGMKKGGAMKAKGMMKGGSMKSKGMKKGGSMKAKGMMKGGSMKAKGMAKGGKMKAKGMAKGGKMKTKGYAAGGALKGRPPSNRNSGLYGR